MQPILPPAGQPGPARPFTPEPREGVSGDEQRALQGHAPAGEPGAGTAAGPGHTGIPRWHGWLFPVALWLLATLFFGGALGRWSDDYQWAKRDPVTGDVLRWTEDMHGQFWRPLHFLYTTAAATLWWQHERWLHVVGAAVHALAVVLLWTLLRRLGRSVHSAGAAALMFLVYPVHYQVVFWPSATSTGVAACLFLALCLMVVGFARRSWSWWTVLPMIAVAFAIPCFNEQASTGIAALPLLYWACAPAGEPAGRRIVRGLGPPLLCAAACAAYLVLYVRSTIDGYPGTPGSLLPLDQWWGKIQGLVDNIREGLMLKAFRRGALGLGWSTMTGVIPAWAWIAALGGLGYLWVRRFVVVPSEGEPGTPVTPARERGFQVLFGLAYGAIAWLPAIAVSQYSAGFPDSSRLYYAPLIGWAIAAAAVADTVGGWTNRSRAGAVRGRALVGAALAAIAVVGAVMMVGIQANFRARARLDALEGERLRALVPSPPPNAFFLPLRMENTPVSTPSARFDRALHSAWAFPWSSRWFIRELYARRDVYCGYASPWGGPFVLAVTEQDGILGRNPMGGPFEGTPQSGYRIPWDLLLPFTISRAGLIELVDSVVLEEPDGSERTVRVPGVSALAGTPAAPPVRPWRYPALSWTGQGVPAGVTQIEGWRWRESGAPAPLVDVPWWGGGRWAIPVHPSYTGAPDRWALVATLPASDRASRVACRATFGEDLIEDAARGDGVEIVAYLDGERERPLARLRLEPRRVREERTWEVLAFDLLPLDRPRELHLEVLPGPAGDPSFDGCWVTPGFRVNR